MSHQVNIISKFKSKTTMVVAGVLIALLMATLFVTTQSDENLQGDSIEGNQSNLSQTKTSSETAKPQSINLHGSWDILYKDRVLGPVEGRAIINEAQSAVRVRLTHPQTGAEHILRSTSFVRSDDKLYVELEGAWPGAAGYRVNPIGVNVPVGQGEPYQSAGISTLNVSIGGVSPQITIDDHQPVESQKVTLSFVIGEEGLSGTWQHLVNAETGRTPDGGGRLGDFSYASDGTGQAIQTGPEFWARAKPFIQLVIPVYDQMRRNEANQPSFPYSWDENGALASPPNNRRTLFVVGTSLPTELGEPVTFESTNENILYRVVAKQYKFNDQTGTALLVDDAWERIKKKLRNGGLNPDAETQLQKLKEMDGILIAADIRQGAGWGTTGFTLNGAEAAWTLKYGNHIGDIVITRPYTQAHTDPIDFVIAPEKVFVEIRTQADLHGVDKIPLLIGTNGNVLLFDNKREVMATRVPVNSAEKERVETAHKNGDPDAKVTHIFRSLPLALIQKGEEDLMLEVQGDQRISVEEGDVLQAWMGQRYILTPTHPLAKATIVKKPTSIAPALAKLTGAAPQDENMSWFGALRQAAACHKVETSFFENKVLRQAYYGNEQNADLQTKLTKSVYQITDWSWTEIPYAYFQKKGISTAVDVAAYYSGAYDLTRSVGIDLEWWFGRTDPDVSYSVNVLLSDHAAMILIQDVFEEMMTAQLASLNNIKTEEQVWEFRQRIRTSIAAHSDHPIGDIKIKAPDGGKTWFFATYNDDAMERDYGLKGQDLYFWQLQATRETLQKYIEAVEYALKSSKELDACTVEDLLELTALGQESVQRYTLGRLVTSEPTAERPGNEWKADKVARSSVLGLSVLGGAVKAQKDMITLDRQLFTIATSVGSMGVGASASLIGYETLTLSSILLAIDATEIAYDSWTSFDKYFAEKRELKFAQGASVISGPTRYQQAVLKETKWYLLVTTQLLSALDISEVIVTGPKTIGKIISTHRGTDLIVGGAETTTILRKADKGLLLAPTPPELPPSGNLPAAVSSLNVDPENFTRTVRLDAEDLIGTRNIDDVTNTVRGDVADLTGTSNIDDVTETVRLDPGDLTGTTNTNDLTDTVLDAGNLPNTPNVGPATAPTATAEPTTSLSKVRENLRKVNNEARKAEATVNKLLANNTLGNLNEYDQSALVQKLRAGYAQQELDTAISFALTKGVTKTQIHRILDKFVGAGNTSGAMIRYVTISEINLATIRAQGYEILEDLEEATFIRAMIARINTGGGTNTDTRFLNFLIKDAESQGENFLTKLAYQGTFDEGFEPLANQDELAALRAFGEERGLIQRNQDILTRRGSLVDEPVLSAEDVRRLPPAQREDILNAIVESHRIRDAVGPNALEPAERAVLKLSDQLSVPSRGNAPDWAVGLDETTFKKVSHMGKRADLQLLVQKNPKAIAAITNDPIAFNVLESQPWYSLAELNAAITKSKNRMRDPVPGFFEAVKPKQGEQKVGDLLVEDAIDDITEYSSTAAAGTLQSETKAFANGNEVANFTRDVKPIDIEGRSGVEMTMSYADGKKAPRFITDTDPPLIAGKGTPLATYMNVRAFHNLNIGYADPKLLRVKMSTVVNANTAVQIDWLRRMYGADNIQKYLKHTHSVKYAESALNQAGFKISKVEMSTAGRPFKQKARGEVGGDYFHSKDNPLDYLDRFGIDADSNIETGFDIYIYVQPL